MPDPPEDFSIPPPTGHHAAATMKLALPRYRTSRVRPAVAAALRSAGQEDITADPLRCLSRWLATTAAHHLPALPGECVVIRPRCPAKALRIPPADYCDRLNSPGQR